MVLSRLVAVSTALLGASLVSAAAKRGIAWPSNNPSNFNPSVFKSADVNWLYDWGLNAPSNLGSFQFIPMQWNAANIASLGSTLAAEKATYVLGFNEPDNGGQANMSPSSAASYWKQYIQPLAAKGIKLVAPAFTYGGPPAGIAWMDQFVGNCTGCTFDAVACHWYGGGVADLTTYINNVKKYNKPIWLSEFALDWGSYPAQVSDYVAFLPNALKYLDGEPAVARYAFFGAFHDGNPWEMLNADGSLNQLGQIYVAT